VQVDVAERDSCIILFILKIVFISRAYSIAVAAQPQRRGYSESSGQLPLSKQSAGAGWYRGETGGEAWPRVGAAA